MDTICKTCGERYRLGAEHECQPKRAATKSTAARMDVPTSAGLDNSTVRVGGSVLGSTPSLPASKPQAGTQAPPVDTKFDKVAYQREYMRKWRAKK